MCADRKICQNNLNKERNAKYVLKINVGESVKLKPVETISDCADYGKCHCITPFYVLCKIIECYNHL
jgi:hypothetical protein